MRVMSFWHVESLRENVYGVSVTAAISRRLRGRNQCKMGFSCCFDSFYSPEEKKGQVNAHVWLGLCKRWFSSNLTLSSIFIHEGEWLLSQLSLHVKQLKLVLGHRVNTAQQEQTKLCLLRINHAANKHIVFVALSSSNETLKVSVFVSLYNR